MTRRTFIVLALCLVVGAGGVVAVQKTATEIERAAAPRKPAEEEKLWRERIRSSGGKAAYIALAKEVENATPQIQHTRAHAFGSALFAVEDNAGLSVCDARFSYGCFHEFMGRSISSHGLAVVSILNEGCVKSLLESPLSCQHGIGHGILAFLGYDEESMIRALGECAALPYNDPIGGCYGGVFMEYNMQTMLGEQAQPRKVTSDEDILRPCVALDAEYQPACTYWQPQWWHIIVLNADTSEESFAKLGRYCREMSATKKLLRTCFEGLGNVTTPTANFNPERTKELCDATSSERLERLYCRASAANTLSQGGAGKVGDGEAVCSDLPDREKGFCLAYARNEANILEVLKPPL